MQETDIYDYVLRLERKVELIKGDNELSQHNRDRIFEFQRYCLANGIGKARVLRYLHDLPIIAKLLGKDFEGATKESMERVLQEIETSHYASRTKIDFKVSLKKFYKWLNGGKTCPKCVDWVKTTEKKNSNKLPEDLLTEEEVKRMIQVSMNPRDRALISVLWESGCRAGEVLSMRIKHVSFEDRFTRVTLHGKTGMRRMPLIDSTPYLAEWIENHALKGDPDAPLWIGVGTVGRGEMLSYPSLRKLLREAAGKSKVKKAVNPHNFRHSRATYLANHLKEAQMTQYFGWVQGSDIPSVYVHLSGRDIDDAILEMRGLKPRAVKGEDTLAPKECPRCGFVNKATGKFCNRCGLALDLKTAQEVEEKTKSADEKLSLVLESLFKDKKMEEVLREKIRELNLL